MIIIDEIKEEEFDKIKFNNEIRRQIIIETLKNIKEEIILYNESDKIKK